jgi:hypothetical protein
MSEASDRRRQRQEKWRRKQLIGRLEDGRVMIATSEAPGDANVHQAVSFAFRGAGDVGVFVERFDPNVFNSSLEQLNRCFDDIEAALSWLEGIGVHWSLLHEPQPPRQ